MEKVVYLLIFMLCAEILSAKEYHVSVKGNDQYAGTAAQPFRSIGKAALMALPGDSVTVHAGIYREQVVPPRGGTSDSKRITYRAAAGEKVEIRGSEVVTGWQHVKDGLWKVQLPYTFFGKYNPFTDKVWGDWYKGWIHTAEVYLDGKPLSELDSLHKIMQGTPALKRVGVDLVAALDETHTWYALSDSGKTMIYARFGSADPNAALVEVNVRPACFYPEKNHINYITVKGFHMSQAATQWAAPTAEQKGLIGTNWSKGWIIENNVISNSKCVGVTLGKDRASGDNVWMKDKSIDGSTHYNETVHRVLAMGWDKQSIGSHIVRNNTIFNCGAAGICGSLGAIYSEISGNHIYNVYHWRPFSGAEMAGIKIHAAIDVRIKDNYLHHTNLGIWLDWMTQGTRVSGNLCYDNDNVDLFVEVSHGPYLVENNIFLSTNAIQDWSEGGAYAHNLIGGTVSMRAQDRKTPFFIAHTTQWEGIRNIAGGDNRFYNNIFTGPAAAPKPANAMYQAKSVPQLHGLEVYNNPLLQMKADGNVYGSHTKPGSFETGMQQLAIKAPELISGKAAEVTLLWELPLEVMVGQPRKLVTTELLGKARIPDARFENPDGTALKLDRDYFGRKRNIANPVAGPFEQTVGGKIILWPKP